MERTPAASKLHVGLFGTEGKDLLLGSLKVLFLPRTDTGREG